MKKLTLFCVLLCVTGCVAQQPPPRLQVQPPPKSERVEVLVTKPCLAATDVPPVPKATRVDVDKADVRQLAAAVAVDLRQQELYIERANAIILACAK